MLPLPTTLYHPTNASTHSKHSKTFIVVILISLGLLLVLFLLLCLWIFKVLHPPTTANANFGPLAMPEVMDIVLNDLKELDQDDEEPSYVPAFQLESH